MKKTFGLFIILLVSIFHQVSAQPNYSAPKLIVTIVVDQMRQDYLYRFWDLYGNEGFKKLATEGYNFGNCHYNYFPTYTAAGHSCVSTGTTPSVSGIVGNDWYENRTGEKMYCVSDRSVSGVGTTNNAGMMSPKNLKSSTVGDELKLATNYRSKVYSVALKDRGSILLAGHLADAAYWMDLSEGNFISSTYYIKELPSWVKDFNRRKLVDKYLNQTWNPIISTKTLEKYTDIDNSPFENVFKGKITPTFPYVLKDLEKDQGKELIATTPFGNTITFDFAEALIKNEKLGKSGSGVPDVLYISLSSPDYIGHFFGIRSMEIADTYLRLDKEIASFIKLLESQIGNGEFMIVLTADHAGADNPVYLNSKKMGTRFFKDNVVKVDLRQHLEEKFGEDVIDGYKNLQIYLNHELIKEKQIDVQELNSEIRDFLIKREGVNNVMSAEAIANGSSSNEILQMYMRGYSPDRSGDIYILLQPGWVDMSWSEQGTTHGSPYTYDTHVPLLFYGRHIPKGFSYDRVHVTQIAPTITSFLGIIPPNGCLATPLIQYFKK